MSLQQQICKSFCDGFRVQEVPKGYAITSPFTWLDDEPLVFYANKKNNLIRFEDSGASLLYLEDVAGDLTAETRMQTIREIAKQHSINFNDETVTFSTQWFGLESAGKGVIDFLSFMNRLQDMQFLSREKTESIFREDLTEAIKRQFSDRYSVMEKHEITPNSSGYVADILISSISGKSVAIYAATAEVKVLEALVAADLIRRDHLTHITPFLVFEDFIASNVSQRNRKRSMNSEVLKLADWSGGKEEIIGKIETTLRQAA